MSSEVREVLFSYDSLEIAFILRPTDEKEENQKTEYFYLSFFLVGSLKMAGLRWQLSF
jgi:hypothetical protein